VYAKIHEYGGVIRARGKYLTFIGSDGKRVFTKSVTIPARPYMRPAVDGHLAEIKEAIADALRGLLKKAVS
jgi:phage gpG-like protein